MGRLLNLAKHGAPWPAVGGIAWLLLDRFTTALGAGSVNGSLSEPSGHARTVTDTGGTATITGGQFKVTAVVAGFDPWLRYTTGWSRVAGRMLHYTHSADGITGSNGVSGFATTLTTPFITLTLGVLPNSGSILLVGPANTRIASYTLGTTIEVYVILRSTGNFVLINSKLHHINRTGTTATLYPHWAASAADASLDIRLDNLGVVDLDITRPTLFPIPTLSDTFSDTSAPLLSDGLAHIEAGGVNGAGVQWSSAATITNSGNKGYITVPGSPSFAETIRGVSPASASEPYASVKATISVAEKAGVVINLDDITTPTTCIRAMYDRATGKIHAAEMAAGSFGADKLAVSATYSAGAYIEIRRISTEVYCFYNGSYIGSWTTALATTNAKIALYASDVNSYFESVTCYNTGGYSYDAYQ